MFCVGDEMQVRFLLVMGGNQTGHCPREFGQADGSSSGCVLLVCAV